MAVTFYDNLPLNEDIVLDWPFLEGAGTVVHDQSKSGSNGMLITGGLGFWWPAQIGNPFYGIYLFEVWTQYIRVLAADCKQLNFTSGDYSLSFWFNWVDTGDSLIIMGKYAVDLRGWEVYLWRAAGPIDYLTVRHHHGGTRSSTYSTGWTPSTLHKFGYSRVGNTAQHYRNGLPIPTTVQAGGLLDPSSSLLSNLVIGSRFTLDDDWYNGYLGRPRVWARALSDDHHRQLFTQGNAQ
jgi:hypothetical protein